MMHTLLHRLAPSAALLAFALSVAACQGQYSEKPAIHPNPNMNDTERFDAQERNPFFADQRSNRPLVPGVVARGTASTDPAFQTGRLAHSGFVLDNPLKVDMALLDRGQERFNIYCSACHDRTGHGQGMAIRYPAKVGTPGFPPPTSYYDDRVMNMADGQIFDTITSGTRTMPPYGSQIPPNDRWAIVAYVRALQRSQRASRADVPPELRDRLGAPQ